MKYRPEIDGLRAIAVLSVLIFHLEIVLFERIILKGGYLGVKRLARCHPWSKHIGHDPVPEKFEWLTKKNKEQTHA